MYGECVWEELCKFNLKQLIENGKRKIGIVFNIDPHYKEGSHWVSMFIDIDKAFIFYFDSNGQRIRTQFKKLVNRIIKQGSNLSQPIKFMYHSNFPKSHQRRNTECGMYALYMIIQLLTNKKDILYFKKTHINDDEMFALRKKLFNYTT